jgi:hypothetical protein
MNFSQHFERIDGLAPFLRMPALRLIEQCDAKLKRKLLVVSGWRSVPEQLLNYQKGRTFNRDTGEWVVTDAQAIVTRLKPGASAHNVIVKKDGTPASMALDVIPLLPTGQPDWDVSMDFWDGLYEIAWKVGLDPLGDQTGNYLKGDLGHFEEPGWRLKIEELGLLLPAMQAVTI